jgi:hypothetical protein
MRFGERFFCTTVMSAAASLTQKELEAMNQQNNNQNPSQNPSQQREQPQREQQNQQDQGNKAGQNADKKSGGQKATKDNDSHNR